MQKLHFSRNFVGLTSLILAKVFGLAGIALGYTSHRNEGALLLAFDAVLIVTAVVVALRGMYEGAREEASQKQVLEQMIREGTLQQYLRDLEDAGHAIKVRAPAAPEPMSIS